MPHPIFALLAAVLLAIAMAMLEERTPNERLRVAGRVLFTCAAAVFGGSWLMYLIHG